MINNKFVFVCTFCCCCFCCCCRHSLAANLPFIRPTTKCFFFVSLSAFFSSHFFCTASSLLLFRLLVLTYLSPTQFSVWPIEELMPHWVSGFRRVSTWISEMWLEICYGFVCICVCLCVGLIRKHFFDFLPTQQFCFVSFLWVNQIR